MDPRVKSSLLWGAIGALSFLVLLQGYVLATSEFVGIGRMVGVTAVVFVVTTASAHLLRPRLAGRNERS